MVKKVTFAEGTKLSSIAEETASNFVLEGMLPPLPDNLRQILPDYTQHITVEPEALKEITNLTTGKGLDVVSWEKLDLLIPFFSGLSAETNRCLHRKDEYSQEEFEILSQASKEAKDYVENLFALRQRLGQDPLLEIEETEQPKTQTMLSTQLQNIKLAYPPLPEELHWLVRAYRSEYYPNYSEENTPTEDQTELKTLQALLSDKDLHEPKTGEELQFSIVLLENFKQRLMSYIDESYFLSEQERIELNSTAVILNDHLLRLQTINDYVLHPALLKAGVAADSSTQTAGTAQDGESQTVGTTAQDGKTQTALQEPTRPNQRRNRLLGVAAVAVSAFALLWRNQPGRWSTAQAYNSGVVGFKADVPSASPDSAHNNFSGYFAGENNFVEETLGDSSRALAPIPPSAVFRYGGQYNLTDYAVLMGDSKAAVEASVDGFGHEDSSDRALIALPEKVEQPSPEIELRDGGYLYPQGAATEMKETANDDTSRALAPISPMVTLREGGHFYPQDYADLISESRETSPSVDGFGHEDTNDRALIALPQEAEQLSPEIGLRDGGYLYPQSAAREVEDPPKVIESSTDTITSQNATNVLVSAEELQSESQLMPAESKTTERRGTWGSLSRLAVGLVGMFANVAARQATRDCAYAQNGGSALALRHDLSNSGYDIPPYDLDGLPPETVGNEYWAQLFISAVCRYAPGLSEATRCWVSPELAAQLFGSSTFAGGPFEVDGYDDNFSTHALDFGDGTAAAGQLQIASPDDDETVIGFDIERDALNTAGAENHIGTNETADGQVTVADQPVDDTDNQLSSTASIEDTLASQDVCLPDEEARQVSALEEGAPPPPGTNPTAGITSEVESEDEPVCTDADAPIDNRTLGAPSVADAGPLSRWAQVAADATAAAGRATQAARQTATAHPSATALLAGLGVAAGAGAAAAGGFIAGRRFLQQRARSRDRQAAEDAAQAAQAASVVQQAVADDEDRGLLAGVEGTLNRFDTHLARQALIDNYPPPPTVGPLTQEQQRNPHAFAAAVTAITPLLAKFFNPTLSTAERASIYEQIQAQAGAGCTNLPELTAQEGKALSVALRVEALLGSATADTAVLRNTLKAALLNSDRDTVLIPSTNPPRRLDQAQRKAIREAVDALLAAKFAIDLPAEGVASDAPTFNPQAMQERRKALATLLAPQVHGRDASEAEVGAVAEQLQNAGVACATGTTQQFADVSLAIAEKAINPATNADTADNAVAALFDNTGGSDFAYQAADAFAGGRRDPQTIAAMRVLRGKLKEWFTRLDTATDEAAIHAISHDIDEVVGQTVLPQASQVSDSIKLMLRLIHLREVTDPNIEVVFQPRVKAVSGLIDQRLQSLNEVYATTVASHSPKSVAALQATKELLLGRQGAKNWQAAAELHNTSVDAEALSKEIATTLSSLKTAGVVNPKMRKTIDAHHDKLAAAIELAQREYDILQGHHRQIARDLATINKLLPRDTHWVHRYELNSRLDESILPYSSYQSLGDAQADIARRMERLNENINSLLRIKHSLPIPNQLGTRLVFIPENFAAEVHEGEGTALRAGRDPLRLGSVSINPGQQDMVSRQSIPCQIAAAAISIQARPKIVSSFTSAETRTVLCDEHGNEVVEPVITFDTMRADQAQLAAMADLARDSVIKHAVDNGLPTEDKPFQIKSSPGYEDLAVLQMAMMVSLLKQLGYEPKQIGERCFFASSKLQGQWLSRDAKGKCEIDALVEQLGTFDTPKHRILFEQIKPLLRDSVGGKKGGIGNQDGIRQALSELRDGLSAVADTANVGKSHGGVPATPRTAEHFPWAKEPESPRGVEQPVDDGVSSSPAP